MVADLFLGEIQALARWLKSPSLRTRDLGSRLQFFETDQDVPLPIYRPLRQTLAGRRPTATMASCEAAKTISQKEADWVNP